MFIEKSFIDIEIQPTGMLGPKNSLNVKVNNRSDRTIENGRIFLCLHFTDMYVDDFAVFKVPTTVDKIGPRTEKEIDPPVTIEYTFDGKPKDLEKDIVQARAILVTDQFITWIDKEDFKIKAAQESMGHYSSSDVDVREGLEQILDRADLTQTEVFDLILKNTKIASDNGFFKDKMTIQLPRVLAFLNPVFSINPIDSESAVTPKDSQLFGSDIKLEFEMKEPVNGTFDLYMHSSYVTCKVTVSKANGSYKVSGVDFI
jgi:hypothetical protein